MLKHSPDYKMFEHYMEATKLDTETTWNYNSWVSALGRDQDVGYHQVMQQVVQWTKTHHDEVLECLLCLMIFFSQTDSEAIESFSENIDMIQQSWRWPQTDKVCWTSKIFCFRSLLFRYLQHLQITDDSKNKSFSDSIRLTGVMNNLNFWIRNDYTIFTTKSFIV